MVQVMGLGLRYALTKNPTIYASLIEMFWQTAAVRTIDNGDQEITAQLMAKNSLLLKYLVRELSICRLDWEHTPLFPSMLAIQAEEGEGSGHPSEPQPPPSTAQPTHEEPIPNVVSSSHQKTQTPRQALNQVEERATTTAASLDAEQASGNINRTQSMAIPNVPLPQGIGAGGSPRCQEAIGGSIAQTRSERVPTPPYDSPLPRVNTLGSDEGSMTLLELTVLCTTLSKKVESLEADLKQTKKVYGVAYTKLIKKVKKLKKTVKSNQARRRANIVVSNDEEDLEDSSKQGGMIEEIDQDARVALVTPTHSQEDQPEDQLGVFSAAKVLADAAKENVHTYTRRRRAVSRISTAEESVNTAGASMSVVIKDKAAVRLQEQLDEEERKRISRVHEEASSFNIKEWEEIQAIIEVDEELA
ncbi:hypothetical protein Tco_0771919 [Tanacetum coccineum]|uniref:Uncharacterized protein n=1 Tax=Tanacetum coccineum TaxID=301880 RepID=A0ABQ4ZK81_9ASTR